MIISTMVKEIMERDGKIVITAPAKLLGVIRRNSGGNCEENVTEKRENVIIRFLNHCK